MKKAAGRGGFPVAEVASARKHGAGGTRTGQAADWNVERMKLGRLAVALVELDGHDGNAQVFLQDPAEIVQRLAGLLEPLLMILQCIGVGP